MLCHQRSCILQQFYPVDHNPPYQARQDLAELISLPLGVVRVEFVQSYSPAFEVVSILPKRRGNIFAYELAHGGHDLCGIPHS